MDRKLLDEAVAGMELLDIYLNEGSVTRENNFDHGVPLNHLRQQSKLAASADILGATEDGEKKVNILRALLTFGLRFVPAPETGPESGDKPEKVLAEIEATFCAVYRFPESLGDEHLEEFLRFNAVHNVWPFWREHALRVASEAKLPRPSIPLMKPGEKQS